MLKVLQTSVARRNDLGGSKDRRLLHYVVFCRPSSLKKKSASQFQTWAPFFLRFKSNQRESWGVAVGRISQVCWMPWPHFWSLVGRMPLSPWFFGGNLQGGNASKALLNTRGCLNLRKLQGHTHHAGHQIKGTPMDDWFSTIFGWSKGLKRWLDI